MGGVSIIAKRLKEARKRAGLSQRQLGIEAGINISGASSRINQYERAVHNPDPSILKGLATVLKAPLPYFYCEDAELADLILKFSVLEVAQRKRLIDFMDGL
ncbi:MAG TPA: helix-turn-helix transcriptional regulator [Steroidobacteraceae bacterium]|jgi:transcriptional regulator with XRE-family HTH domain|nr:helix-turn-helix transcriptional regulator [Steroidobacteraceae bacterium]